MTDSRSSRVGNCRTAGRAGITDHGKRSPSKPRNVRIQFVPLGSCFRICVRTRKERPDPISAMYAYSLSRLLLFPCLLANATGNTRSDFGMCGSQPRAVHVQSCVQRGKGCLRLILISADARICNAQRRQMRDASKNTMSLSTDTCPPAPSRCRSEPANRFPVGCHCLTKEGCAKTAGPIRASML